MRVTSLSLMLCVAVLSIRCQPAAEETSPPDEAATETPANDVDRLRAQSEQFATYFESGDADGIASLFHERGDTVGPDGVRVQGRDAVRSRYEALFAGSYRGAVIRIEQSSVKFPTPATAIVAGTYAISGAQTDSGPRDLNGTYTNVAVKENGQWVLHAVRTMVPIAIPQP